jgi:hypothetical protein
MPRKIIVCMPKLSKEGFIERARIGGTIGAVCGFVIAMICGTKGGPAGLDGQRQLGFWGVIGITLFFAIVCGASYGFHPDPIEKPNRDDGD